MKRACVWFKGATKSRRAGRWWSSWLGWLCCAGQVLLPAWGAEVGVEHDTKETSRLVITVGPADADVVGSTGRAIQLAVDAAAVRGGGTVRVLPGEYLLLDSIHLRSNVSLLGAREKTVLRRAP